MDAAQILLRVQERREEMEQVEMFLTIAAIIVTLGSFYPFWCRYKHSKFPYSDTQLAFRRDILMIQFSPMHKPFNPRLGLRFIQSFAVFEVIKRFVTWKKSNGTN